MSRAYREGLTKVIKTRLRPDDLNHDFLALGAMYDVPGLVHGQSRCFSYHDGNLAQSLKSPYCPTGLSPKRIKEGLEFERRVYLGTNRIFAMSEYLRRSFVEDYGVPASRVSNIGAGINLDRVPEPLPDKRYDTKQLLFIGADFVRKGGRQLLEAFRHVHEIHPDATLHIVGPQHLNLPPGQSQGIEFYGFLDKTNPDDARTLRELFGKCCLFVLPSLYEPFGIAPLEAMAHQIPAVVSRGWALEEMVTPGISGAHVEPGAVEDLVERLKMLLADPDSLREMGAAAREHVLRRYTWTQVVARMMTEIRAVQENQFSIGELGPQESEIIGNRYERV
jgi:glycosyltransferase involved in cell wall biosynthesis